MGTKSGCERKKVKKSHSRLPGSIRRPKDISAMPLQSFALPTELNRDADIQIWRSYVPMPLTSNRMRVQHSPQ